MISLSLSRLPEKPTTDIKRKKTKTNTVKEFVICRHRYPDTAHM